MAVDMILKLDGIKGESKVDGYEGEIDVLAWSWGGSQSGTAHSGGGSGGGKVSIQNISISKYIDKSSATLYLKMCKGDHIKKGTLIVRKAGGAKALEYIKVAMEQILVSGLQLGGSGGEDRLTENLTLNCAKFHYEYKPQKEDGSGDTAIECKWDIPAGKAY